MNAPKATTLAAVLELVFRAVGTGERGFLPHYANPPF